MKWLVLLSDFMIPLLLFYIVGHGLMTRRPVYEDFMKGAKDGLKVVIEILPTLIGLMMAVSVLRSSGFLEALSDFLSPFTEALHLPAPVLPVLLVKMFSSSAATGLVLDVFKEFGPDSLIGRITSIMMSCTETIFYTMSIYFMSVKVKKTRYTLAGALIATLAGVVMSVLLAGWM